MSSSNEDTYESTDSTSKRTHASYDVDERRDEDTEVKRIINKQHRPDPNAFVLTSISRLWNTKSIAYSL